MAILLALSDEPLRFSDLDRRLGHETAETGFRRALRDLEAERLVDHAAQVYQLTDLGRQLLDLLGPGAAWAARNRDHLSGRRPRNEHR